MALGIAGEVYIADFVSNNVREVCASTAAVDPDDGCDFDFSNPGPGLPCIQDHGGDVNGDGYSDSDELTAHGAKTCVGQFPASGGLGLSGLSSTAIDVPCPGRLPGSAGAKNARADIDLDGKVTILDISSAAGNFNKQVAGPYDRRAESDQDGDHQITILDISTMASVFTMFVPPC